ncbi:MAG: Rho termination factor [Planctomycetaceae bacterium]|nr:Rho termination factor [Planctomycetaceae bacterium]MCA9112566.1 Rho termination factor [Planctomycetaceae bacterium]
MSHNHGPTFKDEMQYESLRDDGMSKENAVRIANTPNSKAARKRGQSSPYEEWTKNELYERAQEIDISGRSQMTKEEIIDAFRHH